MTNATFEYKVLAEMIRRGDQPEEKAVRYYNRQKWIFALLGFAIFLGASWWSKSRKDNDAVVLAWIGGICSGMGYMYFSAARQVPILRRYSTLKVEDIQKRLDELRTEK